MELTEEAARNCHTQGLRDVPVTLCFRFVVCRGGRCLLNQAPDGPNSIVHGRPAPLHLFHGFYCAYAQVLAVVPS